MIRVLVVDDYEPWHKFVTVTLEADDRFKVIGLASDGPGAIEMCRVLRPDVILLDINLSEWNGMLVAEKIRGVAPEARIIFFSNHVSADLVTAAFKAGARGFVAKRDGRELLIAVHVVMSGGEYLSERVRELRADPEVH